MRAGLVAVAVLLVFGAGGAAATAKTAISIADEGFKPTVAIVAPGTDVTWTNDGKTKHSTVGESWSSGDLAPGASFTRRFDRFGQFPYRDGANPDLKGTVVVIAATRSGRPHGSADYLYRATAAFSLREEWEYWDPLFHSTKGGCNAQVGKGSRVVRWTARIPLLTYKRLPGFELLSMKRGAPTRLDVWRDSQDAKVMEVGRSARVPCGDGTSYFTADIDASCTQDLAGKLLKIMLGWSPSATKNRLLLWNDHGNLQVTCEGPSHIGQLRDIEELPLLIAFPWDGAQAGPLTTAEVRALRAGHNVTIVRSLDLAFTAPCCAAYNPGPGGVWVRIGAIITTKALLDVRLTRR